MKKPVSHFIVGKIILALVMFSTTQAAFNQTLFEVLHLYSIPAWNHHILLPGNQCTTSHNLDLSNILISPALND